MKKLSLKPPDRVVALQARWDEQGPADLGPCGESQWTQSWRGSLGSDTGADLLQEASLISTGVCVIPWVFHTERRSSGSVPSTHLSSSQLD